MFALVLISGCSDDDPTPTQPKSTPSGPETLVAADKNGDIYTVSTSTGADVLRIDTSTDNAGTQVEVGKVSSMVYVPSMSRWLVGTGGNAQCGGCIQLLNAATGVMTTLSSGEGYSGISGLAINPNTGKIYSFASDTITGPLWEVSPSDGTFTEVSANVETGGSSGNGTTFSGGILYHIGADELWSVNPTSGASTMIATLTFSGFPTFQGSPQPIGSLTTRASDGAVFGILKDGGGSSSGAIVTYLVRVNVSTGNVTNVGANTNLLDGLAFVPTTVLP
jgi:hypothetical protein